jgi:hypothetical protein
VLTPDNAFFEYLYGGPGTNGGAVIGGSGSALPSDAGSALDPAAGDALAEGAAAEGAVVVEPVIEEPEPASDAVDAAPAAGEGAATSAP